MTQVGEGHEADSHPVMTFGAPTVGEILADRYRLEEHINNDAADRQVWRGVDIVLRRPVAVVLRYPGGDAAVEMLDAAVAASRVTHSNLVGVYDAIDEGDRAYVVREWVDGAALRDYVAQAPLDAARATTVAHAVASAVAAVHETGMAHGNIHPGTVLIGTDGRVVLADARAHGTAAPEQDVRAVGAVLYFALTGHWPQIEAGRQRLPDAVRDTNGVLAPPHRIRAGVPSYLDELVTDLLDPRLGVPSAGVLAGELGRLDAQSEVEATMDAAYYDDNESPLGFGAVAPGETHRPAGKKVAIGVVVLLLVAVAGLLIGLRLLQSAAADGPPSAGGTPTAGTGPTGGNNEVIQVAADKVRVIDPGGDRTELRGVENVVDGNLETAWKTQRYKNNSRFGGLKPGMGVLINLGEARRVSVEVVLSAPLASAQLRTGSADAESTKAGDQQIVDTYQVGTVSPAEYTDHNGIKMVFEVTDPAQYLLFWITSMPKADDGQYQIGVQEIVLHAR